MPTYSAIRLGASLLGLTFLMACQVDTVPEKNGLASFTSSDAPDAFAEYWYQGEAEVNSYKLELTRYGENRTGDAVLIFVTEDLSASKQVKLDNPDQDPSDKISILKLNHIWKFKTGIYDYSMMGSTFTPVDLKRHPHSLKQTTTSQDWCGHTFSQLNFLERDAYRLREFSYFEMEGDQTSEISCTLMEDELWNRIRINPRDIPTGEVDLLPSLFYHRLSHDPLKTKKARIQLIENEGTTQCKVEYLHLDRTLTIQFENAFPYRIRSWTEESNGKVLVRATLKESIKSAYWNRNGNQYRPLRDSLLLTY